MTRSTALVATAATLAFATGCDQPLDEVSAVPPGEVLVVRQMACPVGGCGPGGPGGPGEPGGECIPCGTCRATPCSTAVCTCELGCERTAVEDGVTCSDGRGCTTGDRCMGGVCQGTLKPCAGDQCHNAGTCNETTGTCSMGTPKPDGTGCNDNDKCTQTDACAAGACKGSNPVVCVGDDCHNPGTCAPVSGVCSVGTAKADGNPCSDGSKCTQTDTCEAGTCRGRNPVVCVGDQCHDPGVCEPITGVCARPARTGRPCDDGNACTYGETCSNQGVCGPGTAIVCQSDDLATRMCNGTAACTVVPKPGAACDDGDPCTRDDVRRTDGMCAGTPYTCPVTSCLLSSACDGNNGCQSMPKVDNMPCDDGDPCSVGDRCQKGACVSGAPMVCTAADACHDPGACERSTGRCTTVLKPGSTCSDGGASADAAVDAPAPAVDAPIADAPRAADSPSRLDAAPVDSSGEGVVHGNDAGPSTAPMDGGEPASSPDAGAGVEIGGCAAGGRLPRSPSAMLLVLAAAWALAWSRTARPRRGRARRGGPRRGAG